MQRVGAAPEVQIHVRDRAVIAAHAIELAVDEAFDAIGEQRSRNDEQRDHGDQGNTGSSKAI